MFLKGAFFASMIKNIINEKMELLDIVNDKNEVIGHAEREEIYRKKLPHRIVHVLIFDDQGKMALHKRSNSVSFCPNHWSTPVGGHVLSGETYKQAALREYKEELGINSPVEFAFEDVYDDGIRPKKFLQTFKTLYNGPFNINPKAVQEIRFFTLDEIKEMIKNKELFHPELLFLLKKHFNV